MVAFETLLLGIILGRASVRLMVAPPVTRVEVRLDGAPTRTLEGPPWAFDQDFGTDLLPHELTAVGLDGSGHQVGRATQWVNLGREKAAVSVILERDPATHQPAAAVVAWKGPPDSALWSVEATLDGGPLPVPNPNRIALPPTNPDRSHLFSAEVTFSGNLRARADVAFGGDVIASAATELTAVPVVLPSGLDSLDLPDLRDLFVVDGVRGEPLVVEKSRAEVAFVIDQAARDVDPTSVCRHGPGVARTKPAPDGDRFSIFTTVARRVVTPDEVGYVFPKSRSVGLASLDGCTVLRGAAFGPAAVRRQTIAETVATAAAEVSASNQRRAVVLLLAESPWEGRPVRSRRGHAAAPKAHDGSNLGITSVQAYLRALHVPLFVWSLTGPLPPRIASAWGQAEDASTPERLRAAIARLRAALDSQRIVWFSGRHLPQRITLDESATAIRLAR